MSGFPRAAALAVGRESRSITVIIVEDFGPFRDIYRMLLSGDPRIKCIACATRGDEALALARTQKPDVWLLDISLPDANGLDIARRLKDACPLAHVVVLGEDNGQEYHAAAKASGASAYLPKEHTVHLLGSLIHGFVAQPVC